MEVCRFLMGGEASASVMDGHAAGKMVLAADRCRNRQVMVALAHVPRSGQEAMVRLGTTPFLSTGCNAFAKKLALR